MEFPVNNRHPDIIFHTNGRIDICARLAAALSLKEGDAVSIFSDKGEVYLYSYAKAGTLPNSRIAGRCFHPRKGCQSLRAQSVRICTAMRKMCDSSGILRIPAGDPVFIDDIGCAVPLITRNNLN